MTAPARVGGDDTVRLFLALRLPGDVLDTLSAWSDIHLRHGRRVARDNLHITLAFLGRQPPSAVEQALAAFRRAAGRSAPAPLEPRRWAETRSVGMVVLGDTTGGAGRFVDDLQGRLEHAGIYQREKRPWLPHVTMLRFRTRPRLRPPLPGTGTFVPSDAAAFLSHLHPSGARYEVLESMALGGGPIDESR